MSDQHGIAPSPVLQRRRITACLRAEVVEHYESGMSSRRVAAILGLGRTSVLEILKSAGVELRPQRAGRLTRRTTIALIGVAIALVAVIAAAVGIPALVKHGPSESSPTSASPPTSSSPPTPSERSYAAQVVLPFTGLDSPSGLAVDSAGNVYVTDTVNDRVLKLAAGSSTQEVLPFTGLDKPSSVAVDSADNLYVIDHNHWRVLKLAAGSSTATELPFTGLSLPYGVAVDNFGALYVTDKGNNRVLKLPVQ